MIRIDRETRQQLTEIAFIMNRNTIQALFDTFQEIFLVGEFCWIGRENYLFYREELDRLKQNDLYILIFPNFNTIQALEVRALERVKRSRIVLDFDYLSHVFSPSLRLEQNAMALFHHIDDRFHRYYDKPMKRKQIRGERSYHAGMDLAYGMDVDASLRIQIPKEAFNMAKDLLANEEARLKEILNEKIGNIKYGENVIRMEDVDIKFKDRKQRKEIIKFNTLESMLLIPNK